MFEEEGKRKNDDDIMSEFRFSYIIDMNEKCEVTLTWEY